MKSINGDVKKDLTIRNATYTVNAAGQTIVAGRVLGRNGDKEINVNNIIVVKGDVESGTFETMYSRYKIVA